MLVSTGPSYSADFTFRYFPQFLGELAINEWNFTFVNNSGSNLAQLREACIYYHGDGLNGDIFEGLDYDYILMFDNDVLFTYKDFDKLVKANKDICTGFYIKDIRTGSYVNGKVSDDFDEKGSTIDGLGIDDIKMLSRPFEVLVGGIGFTLIKKGVFENVPRPYFQSCFYKFPAGNLQFVSEDVHFYLEARKAGYKTYSHPGVILPHIKTWAWTPEMLVRS